MSVPRNSGALRTIRTGLWMFAWGALIWSLAARLVYACGYAASWDAVDFALALDRFDLLAMQPHFPGYPYFILGGMAVHRWIGNPAAALSVWNALAMATAAVPVYALARRCLAPLPAFLAASALQTLPYLWVLGTEPMSEGVGAALVWWYVWLVVRARERLTIPSQLGAVAAFGLLSGVRISFFPLAAAMPLVWYLDWRKHRKLSRIALYAAAMIGSQLLWVAVLALSEGSPAGLAKLAEGFVSGHFNEWGGGVAASSMGWTERLYRFLVQNVLRTGWLGQSAAAGWAWGLLAVPALIGSLWNRPRWRTSTASVPPSSLNRGRYRAENHGLPSSGALLAFMAAVYGGWALLGQNIDKPRHIVPLVLLVSFLALVRLAGRLPQRTAVLGLALLTGVHTAAGTGIVRAQAAEVPAVYQLAAALNGEAAPFIVYTWEETRVFQYLKAGFAHKRIYTYDYFRTEAAALTGHRIYVTNKVLEGFEAQGHNPWGQVRRVAEFRSSPLFDPVYHHIVLYEWIPGQADRLGNPGES